MGCIPSDKAAAAERHPCYSADAQHQFARLHLPVAPACNISCNYCHRKYDCVNESRPGVTSEVLTPEEACAKFLAVREKLSNLSVVGIAGPGDALANWPATRRTLELIRAVAPDIIFCLSTNGLMLPDYADEVIALGVRHVTVTVNCIDPGIGAALYSHVAYGGVSYSGAEGAALLLTNQLAGIDKLTAAGVLVKVNIVAVKGVNDSHIPAVVKAMKERGVFMTNIMPMIPAPGSVFQHLPQTSMREINALRDACQLDLRQMRHCRQCRADAVGLLAEDRSAEFRSCQQAAAPAPPAGNGYKIAVASRHGRLVDLHFGHATSFRVYRVNGEACTLEGTRSVAKYCDGPADCGEDNKDAVVSTLRDCDAVLSMRIGRHAKERLRRYGVLSVEACNTVEDGLRQAAVELQRTEERSAAL